MATKLQLKGIQQITLTPVMHYFIQLLNCSKLELNESLFNEAEANPMLEIELPEPPAEETEQNDYEKRLERADSSYFSKYEEHGFLRRDPNALDKNRALEILTPTHETLADHLLKQAMASFNHDKEIEIAQQIIYNLNASGYLEVEIESIASLLQATPEQIEAVRQVILCFEPLGCASRTPQECLLVQTDENDTLLRQLIQHHLDDLSRSRYETIMKSLGISMPELLQLIARLKRMNPRPAELIEEEETEYASVDLMLIKEGNEYRVVYLDEGLPRLSLSKYYDEMLEKARDKKTISYLKGRHRDAQFFLESIDLRRRTLVRIAEHLVKAQRDFLDFGEKWKKPLTMKDVARAVNLNESTISRAVSNKFIASEKGIISLRSFFSYGLKGDFGFTHSVDTVKEKIKEIIAGEAKNNPLSDDEIAVKLTNLGIHIARRTVRNYREEMSLGSSFQRKKTNKLKGVQS